MIMRSDYKDNFLPGQLASDVGYYEHKLKQGADRYKLASAKLTGIPWQIIGVLHGLEAQFDFDCQIFNGQPWNKETTIVPKGKGPWGSWENSTIAALKNVRVRRWDFLSTAYFFERHNGMGYFRMGLYSPYLWSYLSPYAKQGGGKYVSDGKFDNNAVSRQVGAMAQLIMGGFFWD